MKLIARIRGFCWTILGWSKMCGSSGGLRIALPEVLLLVVCGTIGACDDFDETVELGEDNLPFLRRFLPYHHGIPGSRWLRILLNRIDPVLFSD